MPWVTRRRLLFGAGAAVAGLAVLRWSLPRLWRTGEVQDLDPEVAIFVQRCFADVERARIVDTHVHLVGFGDGGTGCWVNPRLRSVLHPVSQLKLDAILAGAGVGSTADVDALYVERLLERHRAANRAGRLLLMAFDVRVDERGEEDHERSPLYTPDAYALALAERHDDVLACASVHPYRADAVARLEIALARGAVAVKWLPAAQGIDPASPRCDAFYRRLAAAGVPLISHAGSESTLSAFSDQHLGNPLRLRRPLEHGVRVVVAHCGSLGRAEDLDAPAGRRDTLSNLDAFLRLMAEERYERLLFADTSGLVFVDRMSEPLRRILSAPELHHRLVNGSDYPICAVDPALSTRLLHYEGYLDDRERRLCNAVYRANPLLLDYVVKRSVKVVDGVTTHRFPPGVFETDWLFAS